MIRIRAPGRICLFGEHQDYLGFPVISMAFSKYIYLEAEPIIDPKFIIELTDMGYNDEFLLNNNEVDYLSNRDYLRSGYNLFIRSDAKFNKGYKIKISGDIPINAGCGSSSALIIAWLFFLAHVSNRHLNLEDLAKLGYSAEVREFGEAGGMMDHYTSALGKLIYLETYPEFIPLNFNINIEHFILGNSKGSKDTIEDLHKVKNRALKTFKILKEIMKEFNPYRTSLNEIEEYLPNLNKDLRKILIGNIINRDITQKAKILITNYIQKSSKIIIEKNQNIELEFYGELGNLLTEHHRQLSGNIGISTPKIEKMISIAIENGAFGAKINGSGFGGCMFALASENKKEIMDNIAEVGGIGYTVKTSEGVELY